MAGAWCENLSLIKSNKLKINGPKRRVFECVLVNKGVRSWGQGSYSFGPEHSRLGAKERKANGGMKIN